MAIVVDASSLIGLHSIGRLDLLHSVFGETIVPPAVASEVKRIHLPNWITVQSPAETAIEFPAQLGSGERESIRPAIQIQPEALLVDDLLARRTALRFGRRITGLVGTLVTAKRLGLISEVRPDLRALRANSLHMSAELFRVALKLAEEP